MGTITLRNKQTTGAGSAVLQVGELALNTVDEQIYMRDSGGVSNALVGTLHTGEAVALDASALNETTNGFIRKTAASTYRIDTAAQSTAFLDLFSTTTTAQGLVPGSNNGGATVFLNGAGTWSVPGGGGDVSKVGVPVNNQIGVWTGDGTLEGDTSFTFDTLTDLFNVGALNDGTIQIGGTTFIDNAAGTITLSNINNYGLVAGDIPDLSATYQPLGNELTALQALADIAGFIKKAGNGSYTIDTSTYLTSLAIQGLSDVTITASAANELLFTTGANTWVNFTLAEAGIQAQGNELDALQALADTAGFLKKTGNAAYSIDTASYEVADATIIKEADLNVSATLAGALNTTAASSLAVKTYIDNQVSGGATYVGGIDAATPSPNLNTITSSVGDMYTCTVAGTITFTTGSLTLAVGDVVIAEASGVLSNANQWTEVSRDLGAVAPDINSTVTDSIPDIAADFMMFYDTTEGAHNKLLIQDIPMDGGTWA